MKNLLHSGRWLIAPALLLAFCSKGNAPSITGPSIAPAPAAVAESGSLGISATGDVKVGTGTLEFLNLSIWGFNGDPGAGGFVEPGGTYGVTPGVEVKLWATYVEGSPANPKFMVEWGDGSELSTSGCGACKATHTYAIPGLYTVKATLDDRVSTMVTRTFNLHAPAPAADPAPSATPSPSPILALTQGLYGQFSLEGRTVYVYKTSKGQVLASAISFCTDRGLSWWTPRSAADAQTTINTVYGYDRYHTWLLSYGLVTGLSATVGGFPVTVDGPGCVASSNAGWAAVRKWACSFCDPDGGGQGGGGLSYCWDTSHAYDWFVCEG